MRKQLLAFTAGFALLASTLPAAAQTPALAQTKRQPTYETAVALRDKALTDTTA